jgi:hypothetical protein
MEEDEEDKPSVQTQDKPKSDGSTSNKDVKPEDEEGSDDWGSSSPPSTSQPMSATGPAIKPSTATTSPRNSSEEGTASSFDIVSAASGEPLSEGERAKGDKTDRRPQVLATTPSKQTDNDEDSDWE